MKIYKVIGNVTLSRCHPSFDGATLIAAETEGQSTLGVDAPKNPDLLIVWDQRGAAAGCRVAVSDSAEAAQPFRPELKPVDAYCSAILDKVHIDERAINELKLQ